MIISHKYKYLFIEIPHTASTAIGAELCEHYSGESILHKHANYSEFKHQASAEEKKYFTFGAVRNPLDSVITEYTKFKTNHRGVYTQPDVWERNGGWVSDDHLDRYNFIAKNDATFTTFFEHFYKSLYNNWFLVGHTEVDFVMRFECIVEDFEIALGKIGIEPVRSLPVINASKRSRDYAEYWTPAAYVHAAHIFGPFMRKWGYEFPSDWPPTTVRWLDRLHFKALDIPVNIAARFFTLSPHTNPAVQKVSGVLRKVGLKH